MAGPGRLAWRPDIRAAVLSAARVNMHRKLIKTALATSGTPPAYAPRLLDAQASGATERQLQAIAGAYGPVSSALPLLVGGAVWG